MTTRTDPMAPLVKLMDESARYDALKADYEQPMSGLRFNRAGNLVATEEWSELFSGGNGKAVAGKSRPMALNDLAFMQWRMLFGPDLLGSNNSLNQRDWEGIRATWPKMFSDMANDLLEKRIERLGDKSLLVRTHDQTVRGLLSDRYAIFDNTQMLEIVHDMMKVDAAKMPELRMLDSNVTIDDLYLRLIVRTDKGNPNAPDGGGNYGVGVYIANNEVGRRSAIVRPLIQRHSCNNSITMVDNAFQTRFRHTGSAASLLANVKMAIAEALPLSVQALDRVYEATARELPGLFAIINDLSAENGWSETMTDAVKEGTEGQRTHMALVNGITYAAHNATEDSDVRETMEALGGSVLFTPLQKLEARARRYEAQLAAVSAN